MWCIRPSKVKDLSEHWYTPHLCPQPNCGLFSSCHPYFIQSSQAKILMLQVPRSRNVPHSREMMHLWFENIYVDKMGVETINFLRWCRNCRANSTNVLAVHVNVCSISRQSGRRLQLSRYPCYPKTGWFPFARRRKSFDRPTPSAGSAHLCLSVDFVFSSLDAVREYVNKFLHMVMVHLKTTPTFLTQTINKRGRGRTDYLINLNGYGLRLQPAPWIYSQYSISVRLMRIEEQMKSMIHSYTYQSIICYIL